MLNIEEIKARYNGLEMIVAGHDIPALIAEVERLTEQHECDVHNVKAMQITLNQQAKNCEKLLSDDKKQIATLKKALEIASRGYVDCMSAERQTNGKCLGYGKSENDDEPCEQCKNCPVNAAYDAQEQEGKK